jgi:hypothetical protein
VYGDELRRLALPEGRGYLASDVDELLLRVADEMDTGRPVGGLVANAALRMPQPVTLRQALRRRWPRTYEVPAVHWLLGQLRRCDDRDRGPGLRPTLGATWPPGTFRALCGRRARLSAWRPVSP